MPHRSTGASRGPYVHCTGFTPAHASSVATLTAHHTAHTPGRRMADHIVACTLPLTRNRDYLQALEINAHPVQVLCTVRAAALRVLAQWGTVTRAVFSPPSPPSTPHPRALPVDAVHLLLPARPVPLARHAAALPPPSRCCRARSPTCHRLSVSGCIPIVAL